MTSVVEPTSIKTSDDIQEGTTATASAVDAAPPSSSATTMTFVLNTDMIAAQRFPIWLLLFVSSIIYIIALSTRPTRTTDGIEAWVLTVGCISLTLSLVGVIMYLLYRDVFVKTIFESITIALLFAFWAVGLPFLMDPSYRLAVGFPNTVANANLYFSSWSSFTCAILLSASLLQDYKKISFTDIAAKTVRWYVLMASSFIVLGSSARTYRSSRCGTVFADSPIIDQLCRRTAFAISLGVVCFIGAVTMVVLLQQSRKSISAMGDFVVNLIYLILWCFGVGFITFGSSPGIAIGNLYLATWTSFTIAVFSFAVSVRELHESKTSSSSSSDEEQPVEK